MQKIMTISSNACNITKPSDKTKWQWQNLTRSYSNQKKTGFRNLYANVGPALSIGSNIYINIIDQLKGNWNKR